MSEIIENKNTSAVSLAIEKINKVEKVDLDKIESIFNLLNELTQYECDKVNAFCEINMESLENIKQIEDFIYNVNEYEILQEHSLEGIGRRLTDVSDIYYATQMMDEFVDYKKLAEDYMQRKNIEGEFCSYGFLVNTKNIFVNYLIKPTAPKDKRLKIEVVNKNEYENLEDYRAVYIFLPDSKENIRQKLKNIDLDYDNLTIQDTHVLNCKLINFYNEEIEEKFNFYMEKNISSFEREGFTTPLQEIEQLYENIKNYDNLSMQKFLAIIKAKREQTEYIQDLVKISKEIDNYNILIDVGNYKDMGKYLVNETGHFDDVSLLEDFIDYEKLGRTYTQKGYTYEGTFTEFGYLMKKDEIELEDEEEYE